MKITKNNVAKLNAGLGIVAGMRTTIAPAVVSHFMNNNPKKALSKSKLGFIQTSAASAITKVLSAAEVIADKMPGAPDRIILKQTLPRVISGAFAGAVLFQAVKGNIFTGIIIGGASALASTFASFYIRKSLINIPYVKDPILGTLEDVLAIRSGVSYMSETEIVSREVDTEEYTEDEVTATDTEQYNQPVATARNYRSSVNIERLLSEHHDVNQAIRSTLSAMVDVQNLEQDYATDEIIE